MPLWSAGSIGHRELPGSGIPATRACPSCGPLQTVLEMNALLFIPASKLALRACALEPTVGQPCDRQWTDGRLAAWGGGLLELGDTPEKCPLCPAADVATAG